ncbi:MAG: 2-amino-4-hydroxy-6-hydroxymethyldihydropteridine diphosphokinase [Gemmatimonadota bacterium]
MSESGAGSSSGRDAAGERVAVGLGSNLGTRHEHLKLGVARLETLLFGCRASAVYETDPLHVTDQPRFLNQCVVGRTDRDPLEFLKALRAIERDAGRMRGVGELRFGPRTLDLDLLLFGERVVREEDLTVPHPRISERPFVLVPLAEIAGDWPVPGTGATVRELSERAGSDGVWPYTERRA